MQYDESKSKGLVATLATLVIRAFAMLAMPVHALQAACAHFATAVRVSWSSSIAFASVGTALTTLVLLPLLDVLFDVLMGADLHTPDLVRTGYAAVLVALVSSIASGIVSAAVADRNLGIFLAVHLRSGFDVLYWLGKAFIPVLLGLVTASASLASVFIVSGAHDWQLLGLVSALAIVAIVCGLLLGVFASGIGLALPDPYLGATLIATFLPVLTGVIVPMTYAPAWLRQLARIVPSARLTQCVQDASLAMHGTAILNMALQDVVMAVLWAVIGLVCVKVAVYRLRHGSQRSVL